MMKETALDRIVVCVKNEGYEASLEKRKLYRTVPDKEALKRNLMRVIDESGESYLYPGTCFIGIELPHEVIKALALAA